MIALKLLLLLAAGVVPFGAVFVWAACLAHKREPLPCPALPAPAPDAVRLMRWHSYLKREVQS